MSVYNIKLRLFVLLLLAIVTTSPVFADEVVIGVLAPSGKDKAIKMWQPTIDYLTTKIPGHRFKVLPATKKQLDQSIANNEIDFFLTNTGHYVELESVYGATRILTLKRIWKGHSYSQWGSVLVARADNDKINNIMDVKNKRIAAVFEGAFGGYQVALRELVESGILKANNKNNVIFTKFPHHSPLKAVKDGLVDVGIIPTGVLEETISKGKYTADDFKIINEQKIEHFPFKISTRLYPYWPLAKTRNASEKLAERIVAVLLAIPDGHKSLLAGNISGWTVPLEYSSVHDLLREIRVGPYKNYGQITLSQLLKQYWYWIVLALFLFLTAISIILYILRLNLKLKLAIKSLEETQALLIESEKMAALGNLVAGVAHEVNTPIGISLTGISLIKDSTDEIVQSVNKNSLSEEQLRDYLTETKKMSRLVNSSIERASHLIRSFKMVAVDQYKEDKRTFLLKDYLDMVVMSIHSQIKDKEITVHNDIKNDIKVHSYAGVFSHIITHLIMNSIIHGIEQKGNITIKAAMDDKNLMIHYIDDGKGIKAEILPKIFEPFFTTFRGDGNTGLGLHVIYNLIHQKLKGHIRCQSQEQEGVEFIIEIPVSELQ